MQKPLYIRTALDNLRAKWVWDVLHHKGTTSDPSPSFPGSSFLSPAQQVLSNQFSDTSSACGPAQCLPRKSELGPSSQKTLQTHLLLAEQLARNSCLGEQSLPSSHAPLLPSRHGKVFFLSLWFYFNSSCLPFHNQENTQISQEIFGYFKSFHLSAFLVMI